MNELKNESKRDIGGKEKREIEGGVNKRKRRKSSLSNG